MICKGVRHFSLAMAVSNDGIERVQDHSQSASEITSGGRSFTVWLPLVLQLSRLGEVIN